MNDTGSMVKGGPQDIVATVHLYETAAGGREGPTPPAKFRCIMVIDDKNFDVQLDLDGTGRLRPGETGTVAVKFLDWEHASKSCRRGKSFQLRELRTIGEGVVQEVVAAEPSRSA
jgi:hypothetical protein